MCHVTRNTTVATPASVEATPVIGSVRGSKSTASRVSPFRRIAKTARVNLNKYWGILSQKQKSPSNSSASKASSIMEFDHAAEMEQNHINEMLEALANAEEQNSINSQIESEFSSSPDQPRRMFVRQRALLSSGSYSSCNSFSSSGSSAYYMDCDHSVASVSQESLFY